MRNRLFGAALATALGFALLLPGAASAAGGNTPPPEQEWSFNGVFGAFDRAALQRGYQVYREVCAGCHAMRLVFYRNLMQIGFSEAAARAEAANAFIVDGPDEEGEMFERPGKLSDRFVSPFPNDNAAKAANGGALPPDLSLIAKNQAAGPDYIAALLTGYVDPPEGFELGELQHYNLYFAGNRISMAPPLSDDLVEYADGTPATVEQMALDVSHFLMFAAEPQLEDRHRLGVKVILFLLVLTGILYALKRKVWSGAH
ncbi:MAG: cytochrome c1 [Alphaproteobacteria bacterium]|nr:cytochrome c1 [Alphaproteobacteria bacterium]MCY4318212.1 cytochrome c1 [Alphaproteobacteria bacterium]